MKQNTQTLTIPLRSWDAWLGEIGFWALAIVVPLMGHLFHWNVRAVLPMHWVIMLAALVYGRMGGFAAGLVSPLLNTLLTGMPAPAMLLPMTLEITTYGFVTGTLREKLRWHGSFCVLFAIIAGRSVFLVYHLLFRTYQGDFLVWAWKTLQPGLFAALLQVILLPLMAYLILKLLNNKSHA
ncbi:ECF transporter S component [Thermospira aquatica]|uniref:ECF transporter S component n=1 Tax=Thermospira aquatica TaxID=2828656 RepID=A0AAX3BBC4_9SPIR|nr:ECF transporter S component [Thermospira aquatica]URA09391.1 ECF transporter S component [Thermospira aquatica]